MIVKIEKIVAGGDGMGRVEGKVVFVPLTCPGETHKVIIREEKKGYIKADSQELLESDDPLNRSEPLCPLYKKCGGCNLMHLPYERQLQAKKNSALDNYERLGQIDLSSLKSVCDMIPSRPWGYRNRAQFHNGTDGPGFRAGKSSDILSLENCPVLADPLNRFLKESRSSGDITLSRFTVFGQNETFWVQGRDKRIDLILEGKTISFAPELFFQSNLSLVPALLNDVTDFLGEGESFLDLYSGVGLFSLFLEDHFARGVAVESAGGALAFGRENLSKTDYYEKTVERWASGPGRNSPIPDGTVVDPPRTGLSDSAVQAVLKIQSKRLAYVSCNPVTQARDLKKLIQGGYVLEKLRFYDFYPQTSHMESLASLVYQG